MRKYSPLLILLVLAIAIFFRFFNITVTPPGLYPDEAMNGNNALEALRTENWDVFYPDNNGREGLFMNIVSVSIAIFGNEPWAVRFPSAVFGILTVLGLYFLTKELFPAFGGKNENSRGEIIALLASFFLATSFWHINFSRIGFRAIMAPFFLVWGLYFIHRLFRHNLSPKIYSLYAILGGIFIGAGFHTYISFRIIPLLLILPLLKGISLWRKNILSYCFPCIALLVVLFMMLSITPLMLYYFNHPADFIGRTAQLSVFATDQPIYNLMRSTIRTLGMFHIWGDFNWRHNLAGAPQLLLPVGIAFLIGLVINIKRRGYTAALLLGWIVLGFIPAILTTEGLPHALRSIIIIPPVMIISAQGLYAIIILASSWLAHQRERFPESGRQLFRIERELKILLIASLAAIAVITFNQYFLRWAYNPHVADAFAKNYVDLGRYLKIQPTNITKYVVVNADGVLVNNIPMPTQTVMFITDTFSYQRQQEKNLFYILPSQINAITCEKQCIIALLEKDRPLFTKLREQFQNTRPIIHTEFFAIEKNE